MKETLITSSQNPLVKEVKALKERKNREARSLYFIEGIRFVEEALKEKAAVDRIVVSERLPEVKGGNEILERVRNSEFPVFSLPEKVFRELSDTDTPQGILAVLRMKQYTLEELLKENNFFVILDTLQDPGNMGTIIRTADAAGANGVILSKGCVDLYNPKVLRSTMGSVFHVPVCYSEDLVLTLQLLKEKGIRCYAAHLDSDRNYFETDMRRDTAIIIGNEANGINDAVSSCADELVKIPMPGKSESLNASIAAGLLMYEVVRQRFA